MIEKSIVIDSLFLTDIQLRKLLHRTENIEKLSKLMRVNCNSSGNSMICQYNQLQNLNIISHID